MKKSDTESGFKDGYLSGTHYGHKISQTAEVLKPYRQNIDFKTIAGKGKEDVNLAQNLQKSSISNKKLAERSNISDAEKGVTFKGNDMQQ